MKITVLTIFPELFESLLKFPVLQRAVKTGKVEIEIADIKHYAPGSFRHIDDSPFGGGKGMIMRCQPIIDALEKYKTDSSYTVLLSPKGKTFEQSTADLYAGKEHIILICGHYEGVDARVESHVDALLSVGDYVLTGGEAAAYTVIDSVVRLIDGVMKDGVTCDESYRNCLLEYPQYTRPADFRGEKVPSVLLSGNKKKIDDWRLEQSLKITKELRPDLYKRYMDNYPDLS